MFSRTLWNVDDGSNSMKPMLMARFGGLEQFDSGRVLGRRDVFV